MSINQNTQRLIRDAKRAGVPFDQLSNFRRARYWPQPKQLAFHAACRLADLPDGPTQIAFGGARGPGKTHAMLAQITLDDCQRHPGLKCLLLRRVGKAVRESFEDMRLRVLAFIPHHYNRTSGILTFPNGSRVVLGHFKDERDVDNYLGLEYDEIGVEEGTTLSSSKYRTIRTCCRTSKTDWRPRTYSNANPGGVGHAWYKARFIRPYRLGQETATRFIPATFRDNLFLNPEYIDSLDDLTGWQKRAWRDGDWDIAAGQFFTTFNREVHVCEPKPVEEWWPKIWMAMDYGWTHPTAVLLFAQDLAGDIHVVDEYSFSKRLPAVHSLMLRQMLDLRNIQEYRIRQFVIGRDAYAKDQEGRTVVDSYTDCGWNLTPANMARVQGATEILRRLGDPGAKIPTTLHIADHCTGLIETLPRMEHDPYRPEDVLPTDIDDEGIGGDDFYDCLRYGLMAESQSTGLVHKNIMVSRVMTRR